MQITELIGGNKNKFRERRERLGRLKICEKHGSCEIYVEIGIVKLQNEIRL